MIPFGNRSTHRLGNPRQGESIFRFPHVLRAYALGLGIGAGIATKIGSAPASNSFDVGPNPGLGDLTGTGGVPRSPLIPLLPYNWSSTGMYVKLPGFSLVPTFTLAAQASGWDLLDSNFGSGLTAIAEIQPHPALPRMFLQYDLGKYSTDPDKWNALIGEERDPAKKGISPITHEQYVLGTQIKF